MAEKIHARYLGLILSPKGHGSGASHGPKGQNKIAQGIALGRRAKRIPKAESLAQSLRSGMKLCARLSALDIYLSLEPRALPWATVVPARWAEVESSPMSPGDSSVSVGPSENVVMQRT